MPKTSPLVVRRQLREVVLAAADKKALELTLLDLRKLGAFSNYFFVCTASNRQQLHRIADAVEERLEQRFGLRPMQREGGENAGWIVFDYVDFMVHVFTAESRRFYDLERLWSKAVRLPLPKGALGPAA